jgi:hypothetical protein
MTEKERILRKCQITELDDELRYFICSDLGDDSVKEVFLSGKQRFEYKSYSIGDEIYACKSLTNEWRLVTGTQFKRSQILSRLKKDLDKIVK